VTHYGRKTGKPHEVTIWFVLDRDKLFIGTANVNRQWVRDSAQILDVPPNHRAWTRPQRKGSDARQYRIV